MRLCAFVLLLTFCYVHCRKTYVPIDKNANLAFINMESGGVRPAANNRLPSTPGTPPKSPLPVAPVAPAAPTPAPLSPTTAKPALPSIHQAPIPIVTPPTQIKPKPVNPSPVVSPITTPGPGTVKQLVNFYDSQGKASPIRPYSYSQAVKQG